MKTSCKWVLLASCLLVVLGHANEVHGIKEHDRRTALATAAAAAGPSTSPPASSITAAAGRPSMTDRRKSSSVTADRARFDLRSLGRRDSNKANKYHDHESAQNEEMVTSVFLGGDGGGESNNNFAALNRFSMPSFRASTSNHNDDNEEDDADLDGDTAAAQSRLSSQQESYYRGLARRQFEESRVHMQRSLEAIREQGRVCAVAMSDMGRAFGQDTMTFAKDQMGYIKDKSAVQAYRGLSGLCTMAQHKIENIAKAAESRRAFLQNKDAYENVHVDRGTLHVNIDSEDGELVRVESDDPFADCSMVEPRDAADSFVLRPSDEMRSRSSSSRDRDRRTQETKPHFPSRHHAQQALAGRRPRPAFNDDDWGMSDPDEDNDDLQGSPRQKQKQNDRSFEDNGDDHDDDDDDDEYEAPHGVDAADGTRYQQQRRPSLQARISKQGWGSASRISEAAEYRRRRQRRYDEPYHHHSSTDTGRGTDDVTTSDADSLFSRKPITSDATSSTSTVDQPTLLKMQDISLTDFQADPIVTANPANVLDELNLPDSPIGPKDEVFQESLFGDETPSARDVKSAPTTDNADLADALALATEAEAVAVDAIESAMKDAEEIGALATTASSDPEDPASQVDDLLQNDAQDEVEAEREKLSSTDPKKDEASSLIDMETTSDAPEKADRAETAAANAPKLEAPAVETPTSEKVETPKVETTKVETPKVEIPKVETPKAEVPAKEETATPEKVKEPVPATPPKLSKNQKKNLKKRGKK